MTSSDDKRAAILDVLHENPRASQSEIASKLDLTLDSVKYHIKKLKIEGKLEREGADFGGRWKIKSGP